MHMKCTNVFCRTVRQIWKRANNNQLVVAPLSRYSLLERTNHVKLNCSGVIIHYDGRHLETVDIIATEIGLRLMSQEHDRLRVRLTFVRLLVRVQTKVHTILSGWKIDSVFGFPSWGPVGLKLTWLHFITLILNVKFARKVKKKVFLSPNEINWLASKINQSAANLVQAFISIGFNFFF